MLGLALTARQFAQDARGLRARYRRGGDDVGGADLGRERDGHLEELGSVTALDVANEMRHELAFENHRWMDLIRTGMAIETIQAKGERMKALYGWLLPNTFGINENKFVYAIPTRELQINTSLTQNPGY